MSTQTQAQPKKLSQLLAIEKMVRSRAEDGFSKAHQTVKKPELFTGHQRSFEKIREDALVEADENKLIMADAKKILRDTFGLLSESWNLTASKDNTNCTAKATVHINGEALLKDVPVSHLLWLEKQLDTLRDFFTNLPALNSGEQWKPDKVTGMWATPSITNYKTRKDQIHTVVVPATDRHPAQVATTSQDVQVAKWNITKYSSALPQPQIEALLARVAVATKAVKEAREAANMTEVVPLNSSRILEFIFGDITT